MRRWMAMDVHRLHSLEKRTGDGRERCFRRSGHYSTTYVVLKNDGFTPPARRWMVHHVHRLARTQEGVQQ